MHLIGHWIESLLDDKYFPPQELVGELSNQTIDVVAAYLDNGSLFQAYRGFSWCRFGCGHKLMGSRELSDGQWVWPEGLSHYVRDHRVGLPEQFIAHVLAGGSVASLPLADEIPDEQIWLQWCQAKSSRHLQSELAPARGRADSKAQQLRQESWMRNESKIGRSSTRCIHKACSSMALCGMALCAEHASQLEAFDPGAIAYYEGLWQVLNA